MLSLRNILSPQLGSWLFELVGISHCGTGYCGVIHRGKAYCCSLSFSCGKRGVWMERFQKLTKAKFKVDMCCFAYTTYEKTLIELRIYVRGLSMDEVDGFLIKMYIPWTTQSRILHNPCPTSACESMNDDKFATITSIKAEALLSERSNHSYNQKEND